MKQRKLLEKTQRLVTIGKDISRCCRELICLSRVYSFSLYCPKCLKDIIYEDEIIFKDSPCGNMTDK